MCGILGYFGPQVFSEQKIRSTLQIMRNRGPNSQNFLKATVNEDFLYFLHSRLSIIDLDNRSNQPMKKGNLTIIFNGEIYNYLEVKKKLIKLGHSFHTNSDTEVILEAYKKYGEECVKYFEGMWAFSIFDASKNIIFLSRDRFGEKPLFYLNNSHYFCFGSEVKFIMSLLEIQPEVNIKKIKKFLVCGFRSLFKERTSFFSGIK